MINKIYKIYNFRMYITTTNFTNFTNISMQNDLITMHRRCNELNELAGSVRNRWRFLFV